MLNRLNTFLVTTKEYDMFKIIWNIIYLTFFSTLTTFSSPRFIPNRLSHHYCFHNTSPWVPSKANLSPCPRFPRARGHSPTRLLQSFVFLWLLHYNTVNKFIPCSTNISYPTNSPTFKNTLCRVLEDIFSLV